MTIQSTRYQPTLIDDLAIRTRLSRSQFVAIASAILVILLVAVLSLDRELPRLLDPDSVRGLVISPAVIIYLLIVDYFAARAYVQVLGALQEVSSQYFGEASAKLLRNCDPGFTEHDTNTCDNHGILIARDDQRHAREL